MTEGDLVHAGRTVTAMDQEAESRWSLANTGNRVLLAVLVGLPAFVTTRSIVLGAILGGLTYLIATLFVRPRR
jgi:hypothetical protein